MHSFPDHRNVQHDRKKDVSELRAFDETGALIATHVISDAEKNSSTAKVEGLSPLTKYTIKLYFNSNGVLYKNKIQNNYKTM